MRHTFLLVAMLMMCSVSGRASDNLREAAETEPTMDDNTNNMRRQETTVCGRRQILTWKRDVEKGGSNDDNHSDHLDKILGGSDVTYGQVPWHVNIYHNYRRICGGAIISEFWILTAASCVIAADPGELIMVVGDYNLSQHDEGERSYRPRRVVIHALYSEVSSDYDIALLKVKPRNVSGIRNGSGILFNSYVQPICLPVAGESPAANANLTVSGWGDSSTTLNTQSSAILQTAVIPVISRTQCLDDFSPESVTDRILCAGRSNGNVDVCLLDYGGPATCQSGDTHILAAIITVGSFCMPPITPLFLTNVLVLKTWINDRINQYSNRRQRFIPPRAD